MTITTSETLDHGPVEPAVSATAESPPPEQVYDRDRLIADHLGLVRRLCYRFRHSGEPMEDLIQVGSIGLLRAADNFDPQRGNSFMAYAVPAIVGEVKNYFRDHGWAVRIPRKLQRQKLEVDRTVATLNQSLGRSPTVQEITAATGLNEGEVYQTFEVESYGKPLSLNAEYNSEGSDDPSTFLDYLGNVDPELEMLPNKIDLTKTLDCLDEREKAIIYMYYYADLTQIEIAKRLGICQMHVSRLQRRALGKLKEDLAG